MRDYTKMTDAELMKLISRLDERAFGTLYDRYEKQVYSLVYFKLKNAEDAADATQETFIKLWQKAGTYSGIGSVGAFVLTVAKNTATDHLRRKNEETVSLTVENDDGESTEREIADTDGTPEDALLRSERVKTVRAAVSELSEHHREVLVMCDMNEMSYKDAAEALDIDIGTVKSRLSRARGALREKLKDFYKDGNKTDANCVSISENGGKEAHGNEG